MSPCRSTVLCVWELCPESCPMWRHTLVRRAKSWRRGYSNSSRGFLSCAAEIGEQGVAACSGEAHIFRFERQTQALLGVVGTVHGGVEPLGAVSVGRRGDLSRRLGCSTRDGGWGCGDACAGRVRSLAVMPRGRRGYFCSFVRFLKRTKGDFAFRSIRSTSALARKSLALPCQATVGSPPRLAAPPFTAGRS